VFYNISSDLKIKKLF